MISIYIKRESCFVGHVPADCSAVFGPIWLKLWWMPPGGARIGHQGALLECKRCFFSAVWGPIWLILWWMVVVGHSYLATRWRPDLPLGGATSKQRELWEDDACLGM